MEQNLGVIVDICKHAMCCYLAPPIMYTRRLRGRCVEDMATLMLRPELSHLALRDENLPSREFIKAAGY